MFEAVELEGSLPALEELRPAAHDAQTLPALRILVVVEDRLSRVVDAVKAVLCAGSAVHDGETRSSFVWRDFAGKNEPRPQAQVRRLAR